MDNGIKAGQGAVFFGLWVCEDEFGEGFFVNMTVLGEYGIAEFLPESLVCLGQVPQLFGQAVDVDDGASHLAELVGDEGLARADTSD